jgi:hypothetical protein
VFLFFMPIYKSPYIDSKIDKEIALQGFSEIELKKMGCLRSATGRYIFSHSPLDEDGNPLHSWYRKNWARMVDLVFERKGNKWKLTKECYTTLFGDRENGVLEKYHARRSREDIESMYDYQKAENKRRDEKESL